MREIKFRAFVNGAMWNVNGLACSDESEHMDLIDHSIGGYENVYDFDLTKDCILMQYTGLRDKNGREIYEGDVVRHASDDGVYKVIFEDGGFYVKSLIEYDFQTINEYPLEIIGNIYENPELLGGEKND